MNVATAPVMTTATHRSSGRVNRPAAAATTMISTVAHPRFCAMLATVGTYEPRRPRRPRISTIAGAPVSAPARAPSPSATFPSTAPTTTATSAPMIDRGGRFGSGARTKVPATTRSSEMPRFPHSTV